MEEGHKKKRRNNVFGSVVDWFNKPAVTPAGSPGYLSPTTTTDEAKVHMKNLEELKEYWNDYKKTKEKLEKQTILECIITLFNDTIYTVTGDEFKHCFGDGQNFSFAISTFASNGVEKILGKDEKEETMKKMVEFFKDKSFEAVKSLVVITQKPSNCISVSDTKLADDLESFDNISFEENRLKVQQFRSNLTNIMKNVVVNSAIMYDLKEKNLILELFKIIVSTDYPSENFNVKHDALLIVESTIKHSDSLYIEYLNKLKIITYLIDGLKKTKDIKSVNIMVETCYVLLNQSLNLKKNSLLYKTLVDSGGFHIIAESVIKFEKEYEKNDRMMKEVLKLLAMFSFVGEKDLIPSIDSKSYKPDKTIKGPCVRNITAFQSLANTFLKSDSSIIQKEILDQIIYIISQNSLNYAIVHHLHVIILFFKNIPYFKEIIQNEIFKLFQFIISGLNFHEFHEELLTLTFLLASDSSTDLYCLIASTISSLIDCDASYQDKFRETKLFETIIENFKGEFKFVKEIENGKKIEDVASIAMDTIIKMMIQNKQNRSYFLKVGGSLTIGNLLNSKFRLYALRLFEYLIIEDVGQQGHELNILIEKLQTASKSDLQMKIELFNTFEKIFQQNDKSRDKFREEGGFVATISCLINTQFDDQKNNPKVANKILELMGALFKALTSALADHYINKELFLDIVGKTAIIDALQINGILESDYVESSLQLLLDFATERNLKKKIKEKKFSNLIIQENAKITNPFALGYIWQVIKSKDEHITLPIVDIFVHLAESCSQNLEAISSIKIIKYLVQKFEKQLCDEKDQLHDSLMKLFELVGCYRASEKEWRMFFQMMKKHNFPLCLVKLLRSIAKNSQNLPFLELEPYSFNKLLSIPDGKYFSNSGYTFSTWLYNSNITDIHNLDILTLQTEGYKSYLKISLDSSGVLEIKTMMNSNVTKFKNVRIKQNYWNHLVVIHNKAKKNSVMNIYLNGVFVDQEIISFPNVPYSLLKGTFGVNNSKKDTWRIGPTFLYDDILPDDTVPLIYVYSFGYYGNFQSSWTKSRYLLSHQLPPRYIDLICRMDKKNNFTKEDAEILLKMPNVQLIESKFIFSFSTRNSKTIKYDPTVKEFQKMKSNSGIFLEDTVPNSNVLLWLKEKSFSCAPVSFSETVLGFDGILAIISFIETSESSRYLSEALFLLGDILQGSQNLINEFERIEGYYIMISLLKTKISMFDFPVLSALFRIFKGTEYNIIGNMKALIPFLLDFDFWKKLSSDMQKQLFIQILHLMKDPTYGKLNIFRLKQVNMVSLLFHLILNETSSFEVIEYITMILHDLLLHEFTDVDAKSLSDFIICTVEGYPLKNSETLKGDASVVASASKLFARNLILKSVAELIENPKFRETFVKSISLKWFYHFPSRKVHPVTLSISLQILSKILLKNMLSEFKTNNVLDGWKKVIRFYSNQSDLYFTLLYLMMGKSISFSSEKHFTTMIKEIKENKEEIHVPFRHVLPLLLTLIRYDYSGSLTPLYENVPNFDYFKDHGKEVTKDDLINTLIKGVSDISIQEDFQILEGLSFDSGLSDLSTIKELRRTSSVESETELEIFKSNYERSKLSSEASSYLLELIKTSPEFLQECEKPEIYEELIEIIFASFQLQTYSKLFDSSLVQNILDILTVIICDNLSHKSIKLVEGILDACPSRIKEDLKAQFQKILLTKVINICKYKVDNVIDIRECNNLIQFISIFFEKWCFGIVDDHAIILDFMSSLVTACDNIAVLIQKKGSTEILENNLLFKVMNNMIVRLLWRKNENDKNIETIMKEMNDKNWFLTALNPNNRDIDFISSLCYILFKLLFHNSSQIRESSRTFWKLLVVSTEMSGLLTTALSFKNPLGEIEDLSIGFKKILDKDGSFLDWLNKNQEICANYFEANFAPILKSSVQEKKRVFSSAPIRKQSNFDLTSMVQLFTIGKTGFAYTTDEIKMIIANEERKKIERRERLIIRNSNAVAKWKIYSDYLTSERSLFPSTEKENIIIKLDEAEGKLRKRIKLIPYHDDYVYPKNPIISDDDPKPLTPVKEEEMLKFDTPVSSILKKNDHQTFVDDDDIDSKFPSFSDFQDEEDIIIEEEQLLDVSGEDSQTSEEDNTETSLKIRRLLEYGDKVQLWFNCLRVNGLDGQKGLFTYSKNYIYIIDNYNISDNKELLEVDGSHSVTPDYEQSRDATKPLSHDAIKISFEDLKSVQKRRFLLSECALEFFCKSGMTYLIVFKPTVMEKIFNLPQMKMQDNSRLHRTFLSKWQNREISNFEYLMFLNTLAGRSHNDLTQYPVFPWILSDYDSDTINLDDPKVYRDLSRPMGALTEKGREYHQARYESWDAEAAGYPGFHYGTHYSSAAGTLYFMMRLEPFTRHYIELQDGRFDVADRMFHSIGEAWSASSSISTISDVKELIPEFFYLPDFLKNKNNFQFGIKQNKEIVNNVRLPKWANDSPEEFIRIHRNALESDYVSEHIHEWIDLIFGYKQTGKAAVEACNVFYYLTYEGAVDWSSITNEMQRKATVAQISNFGQTPHQLFQKPHQKRFPKTVSIPITLYTNPKDITNIEVKKYPKAIGDFEMKPKELFVLPKNTLLYKPKCEFYFCWDFPDNSLRLYSTQGDQLQQIWENLHFDKITCAQITKDGKLVLGSEDTLVSLWKLKIDKKIIQLSLIARFSEHSKGVTCVAISSEFNIIVSGSHDKTCIMWNLNDQKYIRQIKLPTNHQFENLPIKCINIHPQTGNLLICTDFTLYLFTINGDLISSIDIGRSPISTIGFTHSTIKGDDQIYITGHKNGKLKIWNLKYDSKNNIVKNTFSLQKEFSIHKSEITKIYISQGQKYIFTGDNQGYLLKWHVPEDEIQK
eukprot:gene5271-8889_t